MPEELFTDRFEESDDGEWEIDGETYEHDAINRLTEAWDNDAVYIQQDDPLYHLLEALAVSFADFDKSIEELFLNLFIDTASGEALDRHGEIVDVRRYSGEEDDEYRPRVKAGYAAALSDTTFDMFARVVLNVLLSSPSDTTLEIEDDEPVVIIRTQQEYIEDSPHDREGMMDLLRDALPAGDDVVIESYGTFEFASDDYDPPDGTGFGEGTFGTRVTE